MPRWDPRGLQTLPAWQTAMVRASNLEREELVVDFVDSPTREPGCRLGLAGGDDQVATPYLQD